MFLGNCIDWCFFSSCTHSEDQEEYGSIKKPKLLESTLTTKKTKETWSFADDSICAGPLIFGPYQLVIISLSQISAFVAASSFGQRLIKGFNLFFGSVLLKENAYLLQRTELPRQMATTSRREQMACLPSTTSGRVLKAPEGAQVRRRNPQFLGASRGELRRLRTTREYWSAIVSNSWTDMSDDTNVISLRGKHSPNMDNFFKRVPTTVFAKEGIPLDRNDLTRGGKNLPRINSFNQWFRSSLDKVFLFDWFIFWTHLNAIMALVS